MKREVAASRFSFYYSTMTRVCVFVDGENLRHTINDLFNPRFFDRRDYLPKNADWGAFFDRMVELATDGMGYRVRTYWYVIDQVDSYPFLLKQQDRANLNELRSWRDRFARYLREANKFEALCGDNEEEKIKQYLGALWGHRGQIRNRFDGFHNVQNAIAQQFKAIEFRRSGAIRYNLLTRKFGEEKTVDVNLAVDVVLRRDIYDMALIVSGDQDYVPAVQAAKNFGKHVVNVAFENEEGGLLPGGARRLNERTDWSVSVAYQDFQKLLGLTEAIAN